ncbi:MAG: DUF3006 domain-containing protein [Clostridia bacterium]|nr:DUF3006 domain-containing protein [Clostridia bacterium]
MEAGMCTGWKLRRRALGYVQLVKSLPLSIFFKKKGEYIPMVIKAVIDRIENGNAILLSEEMGMEISIPLEEIEATCNEGEIVSLTIDDKESTNNE